MRISQQASRAVLAACVAAMAAGGRVSYDIQGQARFVLADRSTTRKCKGANAVKGKRHASLKARANKRK
jgi:hypothetical protein